MSQSTKTHDQPGKEPTKAHNPEGERITRRWLASDEVMKENTGFNLQQFARLKQLLKIRNEYNLTAQQKLAIFLRSITQDQDESLLSKTFSHPESTISEVWHEVLGTFRDAEQGLIQQSQAGDGNVLSNSKFWPFEHCAGVVDVLYLSVAPTTCPAEWRNKAGFTSQMVLAVVDHKMRFRFIRPGRRGSLSPRAFFKDALMFFPTDPGQRAGLSVPPRGHYWLGDLKFRDCCAVITPFQEEYSVKELEITGSEDNVLSLTHEELFNIRHRFLRAVFAKTEDMFKRQFRILQRPVKPHTSIHIDLVYACAALHNVLVGDGTLAEEIVQDSLDDETRKLRAFHRNNVEPNSGRRGGVEQGLYAHELVSRPESAKPGSK